MQPTPRPRAFADEVKIAIPRASTRSGALDPISPNDDEFDDEPGSTHIAYDICVTITSTGESWTLSRRYSQLRGAIINACTRVRTLMM